MRQLWRNLAAMLVFGVTLTSTAFGQSVGDEVVVIADEAELKHETIVVATISRGNYLNVRDVNGDWLWVDFVGSHGWLKRDRVILASQALDHFTTELRRNPKDATAFVARAIAWQRKGEVMNAIRDCTDAIAINPNRTWAYHTRGNAWLAKQQYDLAIADYDEAMHLDPTDGLYYDRGRCHHEQENYDKAITDFTEAIRLNPKWVWNFICRGHSYCGAKQYDKALADYTMAIELDPKMAPAYFARGRFYKHQKPEHDKALADLSVAISLDPKSASYRHGRASIYFDKEEYDKAIADLTVAIELDPKFIKAYLLRAWAIGMKKEYDKAFAEYEITLRHFPDDSVAHATFAWFLATCRSDAHRNGARAVVLATKAVELETKVGKASAYYLNALAAAYAEAGNFELAVSTQQQVLDDTTKESKPDFISRLELYNSGQPYRDVPKSDLSKTTAAK